MKQTTISDPHIMAALSVLKATIRDHYPQTHFDIFQGDDPAGVYLRATVDIDDADEVLEVVLDQLYEYQVEQGLSVHVVTTAPLSHLPAGQLPTTLPAGTAPMPHVRR